MAHVAPVTEDLGGGEHPSRPEPPEFRTVWSPEDSNATRRGPERVLLDSGEVTPEAFDRALQRQQENPRLSILEVLVQQEAITEVQAHQAVAEYFRLPFARINVADVDPQTFVSLPLAYLKDKQVLPIRRTEKGVLLALTDPADIFLIDDVKRRLKGRVQLVVAPPADIQQAIEYAA